MFRQGSFVGASGGELDDDDDDDDGGGGYDAEVCLLDDDGITGQNLGGKVAG